MQQLKNGRFALNRDAKDIQMTVKATYPKPTPATSKYPICIPLLEYTPSVVIRPEPTVIRQVPIQIHMR